MFPSLPLFLSLLLIAAIHCPNALSDSNQIRDVYCTSETFSVHCSADEVVIVRQALYGRLSAGRCITSEYAHAMGCYADVTVHVQDVCAGRQNCSLLVATVDAIAQPCGKDFKSYLDITHQCVVASFTDDCTHGNYTMLTTARGYLALFPRSSRFQDSSSSSSRTLVSVNCPWILVSEPGRRYNISWRLPSAGSAAVEHDYYDSSSSPSSSSSSTSFHLMGTFESETVQGGTAGSAGVGGGGVRLGGIGESGGSGGAVCASSWMFVDSSGEEIQYAACLSTLRKPQERTFLSKGSRLEIHFTGERRSMSGEKSTGSGSTPFAHGSSSPYIPFATRNRVKLPVLYYAVFGCKDFVGPSDAIISRHFDNTAIVCNDSSDTWYVTCQDGRWTGETGNCTKTRPVPAGGRLGPRPTASSSSRHRVEMKFENGVLLAIAIGVVLGGLAGLLLLTGFLLLHKSRRVRAQHSHSYNSDLIKYMRHDRLDDVIYPALLDDCGCGLAPPQPNATATTVLASPNTTNSCQKCDAIMTSRRQAARRGDTVTTGTGAVNSFNTVTSSEYDVTTDTRYSTPQQLCRCKTLSRAGEACAGGGASWVYGIDTVRSACPSSCSSCRPCNDSDTSVGLNRLSRDHRVVEDSQGRCQNAPYFQRRGVSEGDSVVGRGTADCHAGHTGHAEKTGYTEHEGHVVVETSMVANNAELDVISSTVHVGSSTSSDETDFLPESCRRCRRVQGMDGNDLICYPDIRTRQQTRCQDDDSKITLLDVVDLFESSQQRPSSMRTRCEND